MEQDIKRLVGSLPGFDYRQVRESNRLQRCFERWPLLAAVHRALATDETRPAARRSRAHSTAASLWEG